MSTLAEQLGIDSAEWQDWAACRNIPFPPGEHPFFEAYEAGGSAERAVVDALCYNCPVQKICGEYGMSRKEEGVWGGIYLTPAGKPDAAKNSHKTDEDWSMLHKLYGKRLRPTG